MGQDACNGLQWTDAMVELPRYKGEKPEGESERVIFCTEYDMYIGTFDWDVGLWHTYDLSIERGNVTYWMPVPEKPPKKIDPYLRIKGGDDWCN